MSKNNTLYNPYPKELISDVVCPKCGGEATIDTSMILTSHPPKYKCVCKKCGHVFYTESLIGSKVVPQENNDYNKFEYVSWSKKEFALPQRATKGSAGYDFFSPIETTIYPGETKEFSLEVKCKIKQGEFLMIPPRSSLGFKRDNHVALTNTIGIIDSDYYNNEDNEGEIRLRLHNFGNSPFVIKKGMALVQGIFLKFDTTIDDCPRENERVGGLGSTDKLFNFMNQIFTENGTIRVYNNVETKENNKCLERK